MKSAKNILSKNNIKNSITIKGHYELAQTPIFGGLYACQRKFCPQHYLEFRAYFEGQECSNWMMFNFGNL